MTFIIRALAVAFAVLFVVDPAFAADPAAAQTSDLRSLAAALAIGLAAVGGAFGQAKVAASALDSIGRNPGASGQMFTPFILGLVFIETLVIFALLIAFNLAG